MFKGELERLFFNESDSVLLQTAVLMESKHAARVWVYKIEIRC